ncbi:MAG: SMP-30/gluconolactonase/LRE family protein [Pseudomonadota bacterium]
MSQASPLELTTLAEGLRFPEGPIAMSDGSVLLVEIARGTLTRVGADGVVTVVAEVGGGPNGAAIGPDGACYLCNNGGFQWHERHGRLYPGEEPENYGGGRIERVDLATGEVTVIYSNCAGQPLRGPNDLVFDAHGGFWFTDHGKTRARERDVTGVFYAKADGSYIREVIFPMVGPNGVGLSPDGTELYVAETQTGRLWAYALEEPGVLRGDRQDKPDGGRLLPGPAGYYLYDSLAVCADGTVCVATLVNGGITLIDPSGARAPAFRATPDPLTTNLCFGGPQRRTAYLTLSSTGVLARADWDRPGLGLAYPSE